jgi:hypothetical protein
MHNQRGNAAVAIQIQASWESVMRKIKIRVFFAAAIFLGLSFIDVHGPSPPSDSEVHAVAIYGTQSPVATPNAGSIEPDFQTFRVRDDFAT